MCHFCNLELLMLLAVICTCDSQFNFGCNGTSIGDFDRVKALLAHNDLRLKVASNQVSDGANPVAMLPFSNDMYELEYSCDLEEMAKKFVEGCDDAQPAAQENGINIKGYAAAAGLTAPLATALTEWAGQVTGQAWGVDNKAVAANVQFSNMIYYKTTKFGCYESKCPPTTNTRISSAACVYDQPQIAVAGVVVYPLGAVAVCAGGAGCTAYTPSKCQTTGAYAGLCLKEAAAITTTTPANANPNPDINKICPASAVMIDRLREKALDMHNYRRSLLATGQVIKNSGNALPTGANIYKLKYNCDLEKLAEASVARCLNSPYSGVSSAMQQNIHAVPKSNAQDRLVSIEAAIKHWWSQVRLVDGPGMLVTYRQKHVGTPISFMTRMAWATTSQLGCAVSTPETCGNNWYNACIYNPGGNIVEQVMYIVGTPCSQCPNGSSCDANKLCEIR